MTSIILFLGMMFIILSVVLYGIAGELKLLGFSEEARQLFSVSMHFAFLGFAVLILTYPKLASSPSRFNEEFFY